MWTPALRIIMITSHIAFILPIAMSAHLRLWLQVVAWVVITVISTLYHFCQSFPGIGCVAHITILQQWDTAYAITMMAFIVFSVTYPLVPMPFYAELLLALAFGVFNGVALSFGAGSISLNWSTIMHVGLCASIGVMFLVAMIFAFVYRHKEIRKRAKKGYWFWFTRRISKPWYFGGIAVCCFGFFLYTMVFYIEDHIYPFVHPLWHIMMGIGPAMILAGVWP